MTSSNLHEIAQFLVSDSKGILAADESSSSIKKKLESTGIEDTIENHRKYRQMLFTAPGISDYISGVIMYDETLRQSTDSGTLFREYLTNQNVYPGIKVDMGKIDAPNFKGEYITQGLDGLRERFAEYAQFGVKFSKWRAVISVGTGMPSASVQYANAYSLALYASLAQESGIVPIVEPEVLADGDHSIDDTEIATHTTLEILFEVLIKYKIDLKGMLLKPNMVIQGIDHEQKSSPEEIAERTINVFKKTVPREVAGIVFLSGGQSSEEATCNLCAVGKISEKPWPVTFSFGRALQDDSLRVWAGKDENIEEAQKLFIEVARKNSLAQRGEC